MRNPNPSGLGGIDCGRDGNSLYIWGLKDVILDAMR